MYAAKIVHVPEQGREICIWAACASAALVSEALRWCRKAAETRRCAELGPTVGPPWVLPTCLQPILQCCVSAASQQSSAGVGQAGGLEAAPALLLWGNCWADCICAHSRPGSFLDALSICWCPAGLLSGEGLWLQEPTWGRCSASRALGGGSTAFPD